MNRDYRLKTLADRLKDAGTPLPLVEEVRSLVRGHGQQRTELKKAWREREALRSAIGKDHPHG